MNDTRIQRQIYLLALSGIRRLSDRFIRDLFEEESEDLLENLFQGSQDPLFSHPHFKKRFSLEALKEIAAELKDPETLSRATSSYEEYQRMGLYLISFLDSDCPNGLRDIHPSFLFLFTKGNTQLLHESPSLSLVGTRKMTPYGERFLFDIADQLAGHQVTLLGGIQTGVELASLENALRQKIAFVCVLPSAIDKPFPRGHVGYLDRILDAGGCVLSDCVPGTEARTYTFVSRNHILISLSEYVLLIESGPKGGALSIARLGLKHGKTVMSLPGNIQQTYSKGCNQLIKDSAILVDSAQDVLGIMDLMPPSSTELQEEMIKKKHEEPSFPLSEEQQDILSCMRKEMQPVSLDKLVFLTSHPLSSLKFSVMELEMTRVLRALPGNLYELV
ncbi:MAG: DNA-processing protein DprA [Cytophagales bacterium]|nr:DNA-processing protein DprA [Cytophagales bacterium]